MGLIILESGDHIGHVIKKNPASGMIKSCIRNCELSGFYYKDSQSVYVIYGKDYDEPSFKHVNQDTDMYLNTLNYCSITFVPLAISELFESALKKLVPEDIPYNHKLIINSLLLQNSSKSKLEKLLKYFDNITLTTNSEEQFIFETTNTTLHYLLNVVVVITTMIAHISNEKLDMYSSLMDKIVNCMVRCDAPYFIRYYFSSRVFGKADFLRLQTALESHTSTKFKMFYGNTLNQRKFVLEKKLKFDIPIVDIGCGEGNYTIPFAKALNDKNYIGYDIDVNELEKAMEKITKYEITNAIVTNDIGRVFTEANKFERVDVLITEVIEHMELCDVVPFILNILINVPFRTVLFTTPNHDFNVNYIMDSEFRHHDHKWEIGKTQFQQMMTDCLESLKTTITRNVKMTFFDVGDSVNDICCTLGCMMEAI